MYRDYLGLILFFASLHKNISPTFQMKPFIYLIWNMQTIFCFQMNNHTC